MDKQKTCMVTGHRKVAPDKIDFVKSQLRQKILLAIEDGYAHFISGFAEGVDLWFARIIVELKETHPIKLEAALPYHNRINTKDSEFHRLLGQCDIVGIHSESYVSSCFMKRNRIMVQLSSRVIAVYDGREKGGTLATMRYAHALEKEIQVIEI